MYGTQQLKRALAQTGGNTVTDGVLVAAHASRSIGVAYIFVMSDTAITITVEDGTSTRAWEFYPAARGGAEARGPAGEFLFVGSPATALTYTTSAGAQAFISVLYAFV